MRKEDVYDSINRRSVLKSLAAAGTTSVGLSGVSAGKNTIDQTKEVPDVKAPDVEEGQRGKVLGEVMSDGHVKKILSEFKNDGWTPRLNEGNYMVVKPQKMTPIKQQQFRLRNRDQ